MPLVKTQGGGNRIQIKGEILIPNKKGARNPGRLSFTRGGGNLINAILRGKPGHLDHM